MTQEEIKKEVDRSYKKIKKAEHRIEYLRGKCMHPNTFDGLYSWRIGSYYNAQMCSDCGKMIRSYDMPGIINVETK